MNRVLVTGGSGFIGSHVVDALAEAGIEPRIYDLRESPHHEPGSVDTAIGDLCDREGLERAMEGCDAVIHLAASADVGIVLDDPVGAEEANSRGTLTVLEAARSTGISRVVYGSTIWVYGESGDGIVDEATLLGLPKHLYTATKLAGEMYCTSYAELYGLDCTILRFGIPYGPRGRPATVIPIFVRKALAGEPLTLAGDGMQTRRFVYVEDIADGVVRATLEPSAVNGVYNLSSDETVTIRDLAETVREVLGEVEIVYGPGRTGDFDGAQISNQRARADLGWEASTPMKIGVERYLSWLQAEQEAEAVAVAPEAVAVAPVATAEQPAGARPTPAPTRALTGPSRVRRSGPAAKRAGVNLAHWLTGPAAVAAFACAVGTIVPYLLAKRLDEFDITQAHAIGFTTIFATLICLSAAHAASARDLRKGALIGWLIFGYTALFVLPWPKGRLDLALPEVQSLLMSAVGTVLALCIAAIVNRRRALLSPAPEDVV